MHICILHYRCHPSRSLSAKAATNALEAAQLSPSDVDLVLHATSSPDDLFGSGPQAQSFHYSRYIIYNMYIYVYICIYSTMFLYCILYLLQWHKI